MSTTIKVASISISLLASGGIAALSLFDIPELQAQPASRSLPALRWLFSRGSHVFPAASAISSGGFVYLAYNALLQPSLTQLLKVAQNTPKVNGFLGAAVLTFGIAPFTSFIMIPTNFELIRMNMESGGSRSEKSAQLGRQEGGKALDSVGGKGEAAEFTDLSGPQTTTAQDSSYEQDKKVTELMNKFSRMNFVRAILIGAGGIVGLWTALAF